jgi:hypothetical protein
MDAVFHPLVVRAKVRAAMWLHIPERPELADRPRRPWNRAFMVRVGLIVITVITVLIVGMRIWSAAPDTVRVTVTQHGENSSAPAVDTTIFDQTMHDAALAQRLQRDVAALAIEQPLEPIACSQSSEVYDTYTLTWSRSGVFVEQAYANATGCRTWLEDGVIFRLPTSDAIYFDLHAALGAPRPPSK